ncbi:RyR domain-containing protein [Streptomyces sasae]|uniref:RyR domain-containing protein n=1 Tax=Streptomyces sasae TaxID=1266772 RepID=UPI0029316E18|nr:RyR domain-containing protein [Streptomyces sasae]
MVTRERDELPLRPFTVFRLSFAALAVAAVVLGCVGFRTYLRQRPEFGHGPADLLYYSCQLFVLSATPLDRGGPLPPALDVARYTAPLTTVYALAETVRILGAGELLRLRMARLRGHCVVCGSGGTARMLAARLRAAGKTVVVVSAAGNDDGVLNVVGDGRRPETLRRAGAVRAAAVYACDEDYGANVLIAAAVRDLATRSREPLRVHAAVPDQEMCTALQARHLVGTAQSRVRLDFFNVDVLAARQLAAEEGFEAQDAAAPAGCLIVGVSPFARALLVELARRWRLREHPSGPLPVTWAGDSATAALTALCTRYEFLAEVCRLTPRDMPETGHAVNELLSELRSAEPATVPGRVYVCCRPDDVSLRTALTAVRAWPTTPDGLTLQLQEAGSYGASLGDGDTAMLDDLGGRLRPFGVLDAACRPELLDDDLMEQLARAFHEEYVLARRRHGDVVAANPSMVPWERLPGRLQEDNRAAARHIGPKLRSIDCAIAPRVAPKPPFAFRDDEIGRLAVMEHRRWLAARQREGWTYGHVRDDTARTRPDLVEWELLGESVRDRDRDAVRALPSVLATAGFQIVRLTPEEP